MLTLMDLANEIVKIREAVDSVEVKGRQNAAALVFAYDKCNNLISSINEAMQQIQNGSQGDGEATTATAEPFNGPVEVTSE